MEELIVESLEICTELGIDISEDVYLRFFNTDAAAHELMDHTDTHMKGRMLAEALELLFNRDPNYLEWEVNNHLHSYNVGTAMYDAFLEAIQASVTAALGERWNTAYADAWNKKTEKLLQDIQSISERL